MLSTYLIVFKKFCFIKISANFMFLVEDLEMNDGSSEKPYFMSKGLMKVLGKKNKIMQEPSQNAVGESSLKVSPTKKHGRPLPQPRGVLKLQQERT